MTNSRYRAVDASDQETARRDAISKRRTGWNRPRGSQHDGAIQEATVWLLWCPGRPVAEPLVWIAAPNGMTGSGYKPRTLMDRG